MAVGVDTIVTTGRLVFDLVRGADTTTRVIDVPFPLIDSTSQDLQNLVNQTNATYTSTTSSMNKFVQPAGWRDQNVSEEQWETTGVRYEIVTVTTTPVTADTNQAQG